MKFGQEFKQILQKEGFPQHWIDSAVPYRSLKKCIKKVEKELKGLGLDAHTMRVMTPTSANSSPDPQISPKRRENGDVPVAFKYNFGDESFRPTLTLYIHVDSGQTLDATLSPVTRDFLIKISSIDGKARLPELTLPECQIPYQEESSPRSESVLPSTSIKKVEIPLKFDTEFFGLLQSDVTSLDAIQADEQKNLLEEIAVIGKEVARVSNPSLKARKTDLDSWREILDIYIQAGIFFSTHETDSGHRTSTAAARQLNWFQAEVVKRDLVKFFRLGASRLVLDRFVMVNVKLLRNLRFQEINRLAITKILKKFDKRTSLSARKTFPVLLQSDPFMTSNMSKAVCASVANEIVKIIPQLTDYSCPVCMGIAYKPIRLKCQHIFCIRCMIQMQRRKASCCPLCRENAIMDADSANVDLLMMHFLEKYFPREVKAKQKENEIAAGIDLYGDDYIAHRCVVM